MIEERQKWQFYVQTIPLWDRQSRHTNANVFVPFIITSMGGLRKEGHSFSRVCTKKDLEQMHHVMDVLITQHSKWTARRIKRSLFGQTQTYFSKDSWSRISIDHNEQKSTQKRWINFQHTCIHRWAKHFSSFQLSVTPKNVNQLCAMQKLKQEMIQMINFQHITYP